MLVTGEMNSRELQSRLLSAEARIPSHVMRTGQMSDDEWGRLAHTIKLIADCPIHIATHPDLGMAQLITDVNRLVKGSGLKALPIDGLQWITESDASARISAEFTLRRLKILAETTKIPIIITAHAERYSDRYPIRICRPAVLRSFHMVMQSNESQMWSSYWIGKTKTNRKLRAQVRRT
jgi:replicative DNA helicase